MVENCPMGFIFALLGHSRSGAIALGFLISFCFIIPSAHAQNNRALQFSNSAFYECPMNLDTLSNFTIEMWIRLDSSSQTGWPLSYGGDTSGFGLFLYENLVPGFPSPIMIAEGYQLPSVTGNCALLPLGSWVQIAITKSDSICRLYRNGMLVGQGVIQPPSGDSILRVGQFVGALQQLRIWKIDRGADQIRADVYSLLFNKNSDLYASFLIDSATSDSIVDAVNGFVLHMNGPSSSIKNVASGLSFQNHRSPAVSWKSLPSHLQFIPRDNYDYGAVSIAGMIEEPGYDSIVACKFQNDQLIERFSKPLQFVQGTATFQFVDSIAAGLSLYSYTLWCSHGDSLYYIAEASDLTSGDVYLIDGQSNAHAAVAWFYWQSPFERSFGVQTSNENFDPYNPSDTSWGLANANNWGTSYTSFSGPYMVGVWGIELQNQILNNNGIPSCIINGAAGGSTIEEYIRSDTNGEDLQSVYGKLLYRVRKAGCQDHIRAILWDQGEYNTANNYFQNFKTLYNDWQQDYPASTPKKIYVLQVRPGCGPPGGSALREIQRDLPDSLPNVEVMSTTGIQGHDGCHYDAYGYVDIGNNLSRLVARDLYGSNDTSEINAPNIQKAFYSLPDSSVISVLMREPNQLHILDDTPIIGHPEYLKNYFYLDGKSGYVQAIELNGDTIQLLLNGHSNAGFLTYLPDQFYNDTAAIYEGPWIVNSRGIGLLSFDSMPIQGYPADEVKPAIPLLSNHLMIQEDFGENKIHFEVPNSQPAFVTIYDLLGRVIQRTKIFPDGNGLCSMQIDPFWGRQVALIIRLKSETESSSGMFVLR